MSEFKLADLNQLAVACRDEYNNLPNNIDIQIGKELGGILKQQLDQILDGAVNISTYSITYTNRDDLIAIFPSKWLWAASVFYKYSRELSKYMELVREVRNTPLLELKLYPKESEPTSKTPSDIAFETEVQNKLTTKDTINSAANFAFFKHYIYDKKYSYFENEGKKLDRADVYSSSVLAACQFIAANSEKLVSLVKAFESSEDLRSQFSKSIQQIINSRTIISNSNKSHEKAGTNTIYYGAPGTGKSFDVDNETDENNSVRTVFHPETQYSDFVGCLRPSSGEEGIEYSFKHGPFIEAFVKASNDPTHHYYLIIEEINRAPASAVFGEIFQLLDRDPNGESKYSININDADLLQLINKELTSPLTNKNLRIPQNLSIYATMNSSDQAVMPLDSAFKRRWKFIYKPLDFSDSPTGSFDIHTEEGKKSIRWPVFAKAVNAILSLESIPEDRHLGPWFVNQTEIENPKNANNALKGKIMMYLWDDVLRHSDRSVLFHPEIKTFGNLVKDFNDNKIVFSNSFLLSIKDDVQDTTEESTEKTLNTDSTADDTAGEN